MAMTRMPYGWVLDAGLVGTDVDEDNTSFMTGGKSLVLKATGNTIRLMSQPFPVGTDPVVGTGFTRRKLGVTYAFRWPAAPPVLGPLTAHLGSTGTKGVRWYDKDGVYLGATTSNLFVYLGVGFFETDYQVFDVPLFGGVQPQWARPYIEYVGVTHALNLDMILPYMLPPYAQLTLTAPTALVVGAYTAMPLSITDTNAVASWGGYNFVEPGPYFFDAEILLDAWTASDSFHAIITSNLTVLHGQIFSPAVASAAMTFPATQPYSFKISAIDIHKQQGGIGGAKFSLGVAQLSGVPRTVEAVNFKVSKDT